MLPKEYIVTGFKNRDEQHKVYRNYYADKSFIFQSDWKYIICSKWSTGSLGFGLGSSFNNTIYSQVEHLPVLTYQKWKEMKEGFVLPEKWCIDSNLDRKVIGEWFNRNSDVEKKHRSSVDYSVDLKSNPYYHYPKCYEMSCTSSSPVEGYTEITYEQFINYVLKKEEMKESTIDFTIKGTKLPQSPVEIEYRVVNWGEGDEVRHKRLDTPNVTLVSYGSKLFKEETWVLADRDDYGGSNHYMFRLSDLNALVNKDTVKTTNPKGKLSDCTIEGSFNLAKAFIIDSGINSQSYWKILEDNLGSWPYLKIGKDGRWQTAQQKEANHFILPQQYNEALQYVKDATTNVVETKTFTLGQYKAVVKDGKISIDGKGTGTVEEFNKLMEELITTHDACIGYHVGGYAVEMEAIPDNQLFSVGCVKNIPFKDMKVMYEYTKTL